MEILFELLVPVLEFVAEIVLQFAFEWLAGFGIRIVKAPFKSAREVSPELAAVGYAVFGAIAGGISLLVFPSSFLRAYPARLANLVISPIVAGALMSLVGAWRQRRGRERVRLDRFAFGMVFAFAMALIRFFFAHPAG